MISRKLGRLREWSFEVNHLFRIFIKTNHMRKSVATVLLCFCFLIKAQTSFERSFGIASSADEAAGICSTSDKGFAILGANGNNTAYLRKQ